jgi:predicted dehydrogenase
LWDESCREAVQQAANRLVVRAVYDVVPAKAEQVAKERAAAIAPSLTNLFERSDVDAVIVLETAWQDWYALDLACRFHKPTLLFGPWKNDVPRLEQAHRSARDAGVLLMAAFPRRHAPSTIRLRELLATKLGPPRSIAVKIAGTEDPGCCQLVGLIDWCCSVLGRTPAGITASDVSDSAHRIVMQFAQPDKAASIDWQRGEADESLQIECRDGTATIAGDREIVWKNGAQETRDSLASDRSSTEIILDQFCRRVVGGLVPVADLSDVLRSVRLAQTALTP